MMPKKPTRKRKPRPSPLEDWLIKQLDEADLPKPEREYRFHPERRWRFDLAWPKEKLAAEVDGAIFSGGRHSRGVGIVKDCEKYNTALVMGWRVVRVVRPHIESGEALSWIAEALGYDLEEDP